MWPDATQRLLQANEEATVERHRGQLRSRVAELQEEMNALNNYHNTLVPAASLPSEILTAIFFLCQSMERHPIGSLARETLRWIYLTHICRRWRDTAIGCATLWSYLAFSKPEFTEVMLQRSRTAPLTVAWWRNDGDEVGRALPPILQQSMRLQRVDIRLNAREDCGPEIHPLLSSLAGHAPLLEEFCVVNGYGSSRGEVPHSFLQGRAPSLKVLSIHGCAITKWAALPIGPVLTSLSLGSHGVMGIRPQADEFYEYLRCLPSLLSLTLRGFLPARNGHPTQTRRTTFTVLQKLDIDDKLDSMTDFFASTELPQATSVSLYIDDSDRRTTPALDHFFTALKASFPAAEEGVTRLLISDSNDPGPTFTFGLGPHATLSIQVFADSRHRMEEHIAVIHRGLALRSLETLVVHGIVDYQKLWFYSWKTFGTLKGLKKIHFFSSVALSFFLVFGTEPSIDASEDFNARFPALSELSFDRVNFDPMKESPKEEGKLMSLKYLLDGLRWRQGGESRVSRLSISRSSHFHTEGFDDIRKAAPSLELRWDGLEDTTGREGIYESPDD